MDLGSTIKSIRKRRGKTQVEFASQCGITQAYLSKIEGNQKDPNLSLINRISEALQVPVPLLFFLSMTEDDIPEHKRQYFLGLAPSIKAFINELFSV